MHRARRRLRAGTVFFCSLVAALCLAGTVAGAGSAAASAGTVTAFDITPAQASDTVCSTATFVAETDDANGNGVAGETVTFTVTGANSASGTGTTDANGNASFSYVGTNAGTDTITATDEAAGLSATATATWSGGCAPDVAVAKIAGSSIFAGAQPSIASAPDPKGVELGVRFSSSAPLAIDGIRFFKGTGNTGTHIGNLWSSQGTLLASATFSSESAYGWQSVRFSQPVMIAANTTYVASYYAPDGGYAFNSGFFSGGPVTSGPLQAAAGVFNYGPSSSFPSNTFEAANYWVDVMYSTVVTAGSSAQFTITTTNTGTASASNVSLTDSLPPGLSWTQDDPTDCLIASGTLTCKFGNLTALATKAVHLSAPTTTANCGTITNTAKVADASAGDTDTLDKSSTANVIVTCPTTTQTIAGHIYDCTSGTPSTTEVPGGTLDATGPQTVNTQPNPLGPTPVPAGTYMMSATAPSGYQFVSCGGNATIKSPPTSAGESVAVPSGGAGVGIFYVAQTGVKACQISLASNFNGTSIPGGSYIWFNSVFKPKGVPSSGATIRLSGASVSFTASGHSYSVPIPDAAITFSSSATQATLTFNGSEWVEMVPASFNDNVFLSGVPFLVPAGGLPGGISPVTWRGTITLPSGVSLQWQWAAAAYSQFSSNLNTLGIKPLHSTSLDQYPNGDQAGTPENFKPSAIGGATGGGGGNNTGSYSGTGSCS